MGRYEKLLQDIENNPSDVTFDELRTLLVKMGGFDCRHGKGDHVVFSHPALPQILTVDTHGKRKVKAIYVKEALKLYHRVKD